MKNTVRIIVSLFIFCILFLECGEILKYLLVDDTSSYTRITFHEMYEQDNIDVLFVGSSHCYRSFVPEIMDEGLGLNTFNAGTSSQQMDGSYMVIKEAEKYNDIQHIYLDIYYYCAFDVRKDRTEMVPTYIISDYLHPSIDKLIYLLNASGKEQYSNSFILARRNWSKLYDLDYIKDLAIKKNSQAYKNYEYDYVTGSEEWYAGKGYVANNSVVKDWNYFTASGWESIDVKNISSDYIDSLSSIIKFCEKKGIGLTLIATPMPNYLLASVGNYDEYIDYIRDLIKGTSVDYFDFNLCREEYLPNMSELFKDADHVNCYGAETFSQNLVRLINGEVSSQEMFYSSYEEKLCNLSPTVFGVSYHDDSVEGGNRNCKIVSTGNNEMEYQLSIIPIEGAEYVIRDYSPDIYFNMPQDTKGSCVVRYRSNDGAEKQVTLTLP